MNHSLQHRDIAGSHLSPGDHCLVTEHNRIILAKVVKLYEASNQLQLQPDIPQRELEFSPTPSTQAQSAAYSIKVQAPVSLFTVSMSSVFCAGLTPCHTGCSL